MCIRYRYQVNLLVNVSSSPCEIAGLPTTRRSWRQCRLVPGRRVWERTTSTAVGMRAGAWPGLKGWLTRLSSVPCRRRRRAGVSSPRVPGDQLTPSTGDMLLANLSWERQTPAKTRQFTAGLGGCSYLCRYLGSAEQVKEPAPGGHAADNTSKSYSK